jgi:hypothetical protein
MDADKLGVSDGLMPTENLTDVFPEPAAPVECRAGHNITTVGVSCRSALTLTTCSMECPSSDATVDVFPKLAAPAESDEDLETVSVAALTPATCLTGGLAHGRDGDSLTAVSLVLWTTTPSSKAPSTTTPTSPWRSSPVLELVSTTPTRCLHPQGRVFRPAPWPSFIGKTFYEYMKEILIEESNVQLVNNQVTLCSNIHGRFHNLMKLFATRGHVPDTNYIFMGDFVDGGFDSPEVFTILLQLKARYRAHTTLPRWNHENRQLIQIWTIGRNCEIPPQRCFL